MNTFAKYHDAILAAWDNSSEPMHTIFNSSKSEKSSAPEFHFIAGRHFQLASLT